MKHNRTLKNKLSKIKMLILDVDGVLTDGKVFYRDDGELFKVFNVHDGLGVHMAAKAGLKLVIITAKDTPLLRKRAEEMRIHELITGVIAKHQKLPYLLSKYSLAAEDVCFVGDDLVDLGLLRSVGLPIAVKNACREVKNQACYVTRRVGGDGAVREVVEMLLKAQGCWDPMVKDLGNVLVP